MSKIKIGADELILWLRKNEKGSSYATDVLGRKIQNLIISLDGEQLDEEQCYWANEGEDKNIDKYNLPKTATQYWIDTDKLPQLYEELNQW